MHDYDRRNRTASPHGKEGTRLRAIAAELNRMEDRLRELEDEIPFQAQYLKRLPREFRGIYDSKRALKDLETAAVKVGSVVSLLRAGADVIQPYDDLV